MNLDKVAKIELELLGEKYVIPKPTIIDFMDIEDEARDVNGRVDDIQLLEGLLKLISLKLKVTDFLKFNKKVFNFGEFRLETEEISYADWKKPFAKGTIKRTEYAQMMLRVCGVKGKLFDYDLNMEQISDLAMGYLSLYEKEKLDEVITNITDVCFPEFRESL